MTGCVRGSYDLIVPKFQKFAKERGDRDYFVRGTFTRNNLDFADDVLHFADLGFEKMSVEPVVASPEEPYAIREEDLPQIRGKGLYLFPFYAGLEPGAVRCEAVIRLRFRNRIPGCNAMGRSLPLSSVCGK